MITDINNKYYPHCYPLSKINNALLKKYNIQVNVNQFKELCLGGYVPYFIIITGNKYNVNQRKHTKVYDLLEIGSGF